MQLLQPIYHLSIAQLQSVLASLTCLVELVAAQPCDRHLHSLISMNRRAIEAHRTHLLMPLYVLMNFDRNTLPDREVKVDRAKECN